METGPSTELHVAAILNAAWRVRHYSRGARLEIQRKSRAEAIQLLGAAVRDAFQHSEDFETLLTAVVDGLSPRPPDF